MSNTSDPNVAPCSSKPSTAAPTIKLGYARIVPALNSADCIVADKCIPNVLIAGAVAKPVTTYHSTGIQTQPLCDGYQFEQIFGRAPTRHELEQKIGTAAIGRYSTVNEVKPHQLVYGTAFSLEQDSKSKATYVDAGFQTEVFSECKKALARAKVKALMTANKHRRVAEEAGYTVWAESKDEKVIHSEQFPVKIELDAKGNSKGEDLTGLYIPNVYGEEIQNIHKPASISRRSPQQESCRRKASSTNQIDRISCVHSQELLPPPKISNTTLQYEPLRAIPVLAPSLRKSDPNPPSIEDYGYEPSLGEVDVDITREHFVEGSSVKSDKRTDQVDPAVYVVYDATNAVMRTTPQPSTTPPLVSLKRKATNILECDNKKHLRKDSKIPQPRKMTTKQPTRKTPYLKSSPPPISLRQLRDSSKASVRDGTDSKKHDERLVDVTIEDRHSGSAQGQNAANCKREQKSTLAVQGVTPNANRHPHHAREGPVIQVKTARENPEDEMMLARNAEDRRRELRDSKARTGEPSRRSHKGLLDHKKSDRTVKNEKGKMGERSTIRKVAEQQPRRAVREEIKRYDPRERLTKMKETKSVDHGEKRKIKWGRSEIAEDGTLERDDDRQKRRKR
ncbi:Nn.00g084890.m01.CDS01 [Neocucurbitaria sp. VM-36]